MSPPRRILLVRLSHLGDVVHALAVRDALRVAWPEAELAWAVQSEFAPLVTEGPSANDVQAAGTRTICFERRAGARGWMALRAALEAFGADWAVDAQGNVKSALVTLASGAPRRSGLARTDWTEALGAHALTDRAAPARGPHAMERMAALIEHVAPQVPAAFAAPAPRFSAQELAAGRARLAAWFGIQTEHLAARAGSAVLLHLSSPEDVRAWPGARFAELARGLAAEGRTVLVLSGPREHELGASLAAQLADAPGIRHVVDQRGLRELGSALCAAAELELGFVACDSGPLHLAWSCGMTVTCLAGPQDARRTGPWPAPGSHASPNRRAPHAVVRAERQPSCAPCLARRCSHPEGPVCMSGIEATDVARALGVASLGSARALERPLSTIS